MLDSPDHFQSFKGDVSGKNLIRSKAIMKASILKSFDGEEGCLKLKSLRKAALAPLLAEEDSDKSALKLQFEACLSTLVEKGKLIEEEGLYSKPVKDKSSKKRKIEADADNEQAIVVKKEKSEAVAPDANDDELKIKAVKDAASAAAYSSYSAASANSKMDLSKFGEQAWKDGKISRPQQND